MAHAEHRPATLIPADPSASIRCEHVSRSTTDKDSSTPKQEAQVAPAASRSSPGELPTDFRPLRLTVGYHAPCQRQGHGIGKRLIDAQADGDLAGAIDDLAARLR